MLLMWEEHQKGKDAQHLKQTQASIKRAKCEILKCNSCKEILEKAEANIESDWLGLVEDVPGDIYFIGALGNLTDGASMRDKSGLKTKARWIDCMLIAVIQLVGPPALFFSTTFGWGITSD